MDRASEEALAAFTAKLTASPGGKATSRNDLFIRDRALIDETKEFLDALAGRATKATGTPWSCKYGSEGAELSEEFTYFNAFPCRADIAGSPINIRFLRNACSITYGDSYERLKREKAEIFEHIAGLFHKAVTA